MKKLLSFYFIAAFLCILTPVKAQIETEKDIVLELQDQSEIERLFTLGEDGALLFSMTVLLRTGYKSLTYDWLDTDLNIIESSRTLLQGPYKLQAFYKSETHIHLLFTLKESFNLVSLSIKDRKATTLKGQLSDKMAFDQMAAIDDLLYLNAEIKGEHSILTINWKTGEQKLHPVKVAEFAGKQILRIEMAFLPDHKELLLYARIKPDWQKDVYVIILDEHVNKLKEFKFPIDSDKSILSISGLKKNGKYLFMGTYGQYSRNHHQGVFMARLGESTPDYIRYKEFTDMDSIVNTPPKLDVKTHQALKEGKYIYNMAAHPVFDAGDGYLFIGEAYHLVIDEVTSAGTTYNIQLDDALVAKFSEEGEYLWDYAFSIKAIPLDEFEPRLTYHLVDDNRLHFSYSNLKNYITEVITKDGELDTRWGAGFPEIDFKKLEIKFARAEHWFDNYMLAYLGIAKNLTTRVGNKVIVKKAVIQNQNVSAECDLRILLAKNKKIVDSIDEAEKDSVATLMAELTIANKWSEERLLDYSGQLLKEEPYVVLQNKREVKVSELLKIFDLLNSGIISDCEAIANAQPILVDSRTLITEQYAFLKERIKADLANAGVTKSDCSEDDLKKMMDESQEKTESIERVNQKEFERKLQLLKNQKGWSDTQIANYSAKLVSNDFFSKTSEIKMKYLSRIMGIMEAVSKREITDCAGATQMKQIMEENAELISREWAHVLNRINQDLGSNGK